MAGVLISTLGNIIGIGGGIFLLPLLLILTDLPFASVIGLVSLSLFVSTLTFSIKNYKNKEVSYSFAILFELPTFLMTFVGAYLVTSYNHEVFKYLFIVYLFYVGATVGRKKKVIDYFMNKINELPPVILTQGQRVSLTVTTIFASIAGLLAGMFGVGGGLIKTPFMINVMKFRVKTAVATASFMIMLTSFSSALSHLALGNIMMDSHLMVVAGVIAGGIIASSLNQKISEVKTIMLLRSAIIVAAILIIIELHL